MRSFRIIAVATAAAAALGLTAALAQYPSPDGSVTVTPSDPNPGTNQSIVLSATVTDAQGAAAANVECTADITSQPGSGASVSPSSFTTDANGQASLTVQTGDANGQVAIGITCGDLQASAVLPVGVAPAPPNTGTGTVEPVGPQLELWLSLIGGIALLAASGAVVAARRK